MKKIKNIVIGGIQQKVFNLVLIVILLMMAAYTVVIIHQAGRIGSLVTGAGGASGSREQAGRQISSASARAISRIYFI